MDNSLFEHTILCILFIYMKLILIKRKIGKQRNLLFSKSFG